MSERCEPPEELRATSGYHWVRRADTEGRTPPVIWTWRTPEMVWRSQGLERKPEDMHHHYVAPVAPVATHAEVEALRAENARLREALADVLSADNPHIARHVARAAWETRHDQDEA